MVADLSKRSFGERYGLTLVIPFGFSLFLTVVAFTPNIGILFRYYHLPAAGMEPNYPIGSYVLINRASYGFSAYSYDILKLPIKGRWPDKMPERGDVIVFKLPRDPTQDYVQRVVGVPGDTIQLKRDWLYLNGQALRRVEAGEAPADSVMGGGHLPTPLFRETWPDGSSFIHAEVRGAQGYLADTPIFEVPPRHLFVLGDNRDNSNDSRSQPYEYGVGFVPVENIVGKVILGFGDRDWQ